jgi:hypothetical protein
MRTRDEIEQRILNNYRSQTMNPLSRSEAVLVSCFASEITDVHESRLPAQPSRSGTGLCHECLHGEHEPGRCTCEHCRCEDGKSAQPRVDASGCPNCAGQFSSSVCADPQHYTSEPAPRVAPPETVPADWVSHGKCEGCHLDVMGPSNCGQNGQVWHTPCWDKVKAESLPADQPPKLARLEALHGGSWGSLLSEQRYREMMDAARLDFADALAAANQRAESLIDEADATARRHAAARQSDQKKIAELTGHLAAQDEAQIANRARIAELEAQAEELALALEACVSRLPLPCKPMPHAEAVKKAWALREARGNAEKERDEARKRLAEALPTIAKCKEAIDLAKTAGEAQAKHVAGLEAQLAEAKASAGKRERLTADELRSVVDMWTQRHATAMAGDHEWAKMNLSYDVADAQYAKDGGK